jgi:hypothetical protein
MECVMKFGRHLLPASLDYHVQSLMLKMRCSSHWELVSRIMHFSIPEILFLEMLWSES